jgi:hypothetical protein
MYKSKTIVNKLIRSLRKGKMLLKFTLPLFSDHWSIKDKKQLFRGVSPGLPSHPFSSGYRVQHGGDHSIHYGCDCVSLGRMGHSRAEVNHKSGSIEQGDHTEVRPTGGKCFILAHSGRHPQ